MFRRRDRAAADPTAVMTMPRPPWLDPAPTAGPDGGHLPGPGTPCDQLAHPADTVTGVAAAETGWGSAEPAPVPAAEAAQVAVCWAIDHLSGDPDTPARRAELAVPGQIWTDQGDPAVTWVDLRVLVTVVPALPGADPADGGAPPDKASGTGDGLDFGGLAGRGLGWEQRPASRPDRQWWRGRVALRRRGSGRGEITVDRELTGRYVVVDDAPGGADSTATEEAVTDVD